MKDRVTYTNTNPVWACIEIFNMAGRKTKEVRCTFVYVEEVPYSVTCSMAT